MGLRTEGCVERVLFHAERDGVCEVRDDCQGRGGGIEIRNPKSEIRNKSEFRNSNSESLLRSGFGFVPAGSANVAYVGYRAIFVASPRFLALVPLSLRERQRAIYDRTPKLHRSTSPFITRKAALFRADDRVFGRHLHGPKRRRR